MLNKPKYGVGRGLASTVRTPAHGIAQAVTAKHQGSTAQSVQLIGGNHLLGTTGTVEVGSTVIGDVGKV